MSPRVAIVGAGIAGVACALGLARRGVAAVLIDKSGPAAETSSGNAGLLCAGARAPTSEPGIAWTALASLAKGGPFRLDPVAAPRLAPWLLGFWRRSSRAETLRLGRIIGALAQDCVAEHRTLAADTPAARYLHDAAWWHLYESAAPPDDFHSDTVRALGGAVRPVGAAEIRDRDPHLAPHWRSAWAFEGYGRVSDPGAYVRALADAFAAAGGAIRRAEVVRLAPEADGVRLELAEGAPERFERVVIAAGAWSERLLAGLGVRGHVIAERGYHVEYWDADRRPPDGLAYMSGDTSHVMHGLEGRLRVTSISEPSLVDRPAFERSLEYVRRGVRRLYPAIGYTRETSWMGRRPSTPDSLPLLGALERAPAVIVATGGQHLGMTLGAKLGRIAAELASGARPNEDLSAFKPERFT